MLITLIILVLSAAFFVAGKAPFGHCGALCADWFIDISDSYS